MTGNVEYPNLLLKLSHLTLAGVRRRAKTGIEAVGRSSKKIDNAATDFNLQALKEYARDLVEDNANAGTVIGRDDGARRVVIILSPRTKNVPRLSESLALENLQISKDLFNVL